MHLTFSPALGQTTTVKIAPSSACDAGQTQTIVFKATFESRETYRQARKDRVKVELWTDFPVPGRVQGEWGPIAFEYPPDDVETLPTESSSRTFSLRPEDEPGLNTAVYLHLRGPFQDRVGLQFSFTYRLKFPSGRVEWLGDYGSNGLVTIQRGLPGIDLADRKSTRLNSSHSGESRMPSSA